MTLAMESESELDIAEDSTVDVDASCLMSRTSVETPSRRGRKNTTTTELADDEVFTISEGESGLCSPILRFALPNISVLISCLSHTIIFEIM